MVETMAKKSNIPQVKNKKQYDKLREKGMSKEKSARIANTPNSGTKGGKSSKYEARTKEELMKKARETGIEGRSKMSKDELLDALRNH
jgi:hypothetical protein